MATVAVTNLIETFHKNSVLGYWNAYDDTEMVTIKHHVVGKVDYSLPVMEAAKRIMNYKRMMIKIAKKNEELV